MLILNNWNWVHESYSYQITVYGFILAVDEESTSCILIMRNECVKINALGCHFFWNLIWECDIFCIGVKLLIVFKFQIFDSSLTAYRNPYCFVHLQSVIDQMYKNAKWGNVPELTVRDRIPKSSKCQFSFIWFILLPIFLLGDIK